MCKLIKIDDELERNFYEEECVVEGFATGLKRIKDACDKAGCRVKFETGPTLSLMYPMS